MRRYVLRDSQLDSELEPFAVTFLNDMQKEMRDSTLLDLLFRSLFSISVCVTYEMLISPFETGRIGPACLGSSLFHTRLSSCLLEYQSSFMLVHVLVLWSYSFITPLPTLYSVCSLFFFSVFLPLFLFLSTFFSTHTDAHSHNPPNAHTHTHKRARILVQVLYTT